jgi:ABC-type microcin C transport system permease subunit YejE
MSSGIKHLVEPMFGWLFMIILVVALCAALLAWDRPTMEATGPGRTQIERTH